MGRAGHAITDERPASDPERKAEELCRLLSTYLEPEQVELVYRAYRFGAQAHAHQRRLSGEPYITHPLAVAQILAEMRLDYQSIAAAILHDVIEDTPTAKEHVAREFGEEIAELVDGVSKLTQIDFKSKAEAQAENFRKMVLAMSRDIRVILIKLADRLHNMRTIWVMRPDKRRRIAQETLEIYAPIAHRLGINSMRVELEDLSFAAMHPMRYRVLKEKLRRQRGVRGETIEQVKKVIENSMAEAGVRGEVIGREKHLWSIYQKMRSKNRDFQDIFDVYGFRILVEDVDSCYRVLGLLHGLYKPKPGRIKDYIAIPKANGYQSLHTSLIGPRRIRIEAQVRTYEMDKVAESGIAAHWMYKENEQVSNTAQARAREWIKGLMEMQRSTANPLEFIESVKVDLQPDEVYVFTPKGDIMKLPRGATVIDFAYSVHSDIGDSCIAALVDHRLTPLRTELSNGQTVEVITAPGARPNPAWLDFVVTARARSAIRQSLKRLKGEAAVNLGRRLLEQSLNALGCSLDTLPGEQLQKALENLGAANVEALLEEIGLGQRMPWLVAQQLTGISSESAQAQTMRQGQRLVIRGTEGAVVTFARCCHPIPGDPIVGFASTGRGVVVHQRDCPNVREYRNHPDKWIDVQWEDKVQGEFPVVLAVDVVNKRGVLAELASTIADAESNIESVMLDEKEGMIATIRFTISVTDRTHLARVMRRLRVLNSVVRLTRRRS
ncbi:MAG: bifunctional GTP diphosphokinase/guanosine-3',5'-bis pyrophosphate 3'-pyrophosphohydrolase [Xanthomonadaceae bacterium]|mgnify:CR=1 FL=1|nr:bifunctional GTP diphosphokinase/guanosine-3',5'-bis pyrophosphate 3'-pyrophosphohydrolase [Xanthomonadaceae bacterium]